MQLKWIAHPSADNVGLMKVDGVTVAGVSLKDDGLWHWNTWPWITHPNERMKGSAATKEEAKAAAEAAYAGMPASTREAWQNARAKTPSPSEP